jgi:hypothetical protein
MWWQRQPWFFHNSEHSTALCSIPLRSNHLPRHHHRFTSHPIDTIQATSARWLPNTSEDRTKLTTYTSWTPQTVSYPPPSKALPFHTQLSYFQPPPPLQPRYRPPFNQPDLQLHHPIPCSITLTLPPPPSIEQTQILILMTLQAAHPVSLAHSTTPRNLHTPINWFPILT